MRYLLGIDFGGGSSKATLIDEEGNQVAAADNEYPMLFPQNGWAEQNMEEMYDAFIKTVRDILRFAQIPAEEITALALSGGPHIGVLLDEKNEVIRPAIYWSDTRSVDEVAELAGAKEKIRNMTFNSVTPSWTLPQLMWIRKHEQEHFKRIHKVLFLKDYIKFRLTGIMSTDYIETMGSMLRDECKNEWSDDLLSFCGLKREQMVPVVSPADIVGNITKAAALETGLSEKTLVAAGAGDTVMEIYAAGSIHEGNVTIKLATAGRICPVTIKPHVSPHLFCYKHVIPGLWYPGTATKSCAQSMRWYRDVLGAYEMEACKDRGMNAFELISEEAGNIPPGSDNLFFHPYLQGELTPYHNIKLKASFTGVSSFHKKAHFSRALMEGVAYSLRDSFSVLKEMNIPLDRTLKIIGGGAKSPIWCQIVADVFDVALEKMTTGESSMGCAMLAGVASGVFPSFEESVRICARKADRIEPNPQNRAVYDEGFYTYKEIQAALAPIYEKM